jgi:large subunit ribosomal protein L10Ae
MSINYLVSLMKKGWQNVGTLHIKTSMGRAYRIFG